MHGRRQPVLRNDLLNQVTGETRVVNYYRNGYISETALVTRRKVRATLGEYVPNPLGYTRAAMVRSERCNSERRS